MIFCLYSKSIPVALTYTFPKSNVFDSSAFKQNLLFTNGLSAVAKPALLIYAQPIQPSFAEQFRTENVNKF